MIFCKRVRATYEGQIAQLRRELAGKDREMEALHARIAHLEDELAKARRRLAELEHYRRELEIEQIMRSMRYEDLRDIEAKRASEDVDDLPDTYLEAARRIQADRERLMEVVSRAASMEIGVQVRPPRRGTRKRP